MLISRVSIAAILIALTRLPLLRDTAIADTPYRMPPKAIADVLNAPPLPVFIVNPAGDGFAMVTPRYPPVADLARPMLRIAGRASIRRPTASITPTRTPRSTSRACTAAQSCVTGETDSRRPAGGRTDHVVPL